MKEYCARHGIDHELQVEPILSRAIPGLRPVYEKENAFARLADYDRVAVIDADIYVMNASHDLFDELGNADFAGVMERDMPLEPWCASYIATYSENEYGYLIGDADFDWDERGAGFFNMGLMILGQGALRHFGDSPKDFLSRPENMRFVFNSRYEPEQTMLNVWIRTSGMVFKSIDWRWNALYGAVRGEAMVDAFMVHFFRSSRLPCGGDDIGGIIDRLKAGRAPKWTWNFFDFRRIS